MSSKPYILITIVVLSLIALLGWILYFSSSDEPTVAVVAPPPAQNSELQAANAELKATIASLEQELTAVKNSNENLKQRQADQGKLEQQLREENVRLTSELTVIQTAQEKSDSAANIDSINEASINEAESIESIDTVNHEMERLTQQLERILAEKEALTSELEKFIAGQLAAEHANEELGALLMLLATALSQDRSNALSFDETQEIQQSPLIAVEDVASTAAQDHSALQPLIEEIKISNQALQILVAENDSLRKSREELAQQTLLNKDASAKSAKELENLVATQIQLIEEISSLSNEVSSTATKHDVEMQAARQTSESTGFSAAESTDEIALQYQIFENFDEIVNKIESIYNLQLQIQEKIDQPKVLAADDKELRLANEKIDYIGTRLRYARDHLRRLRARIRELESVNIEEMVSQRLAKAMDELKRADLETASQVQSSAEAIAHLELLLQQVRIEKREIQLDELVSIILKTDVLFDSASAKLKPEGESALLGVAARFQTLPDNKILSVEGHTDNQPLRFNFSQIVPSNWELSSRRAASAARFLIANGVAESYIQIVGYGPTKPVASNHTEQGRAANRRIEIRLIPRLEEQVN